MVLVEERDKALIYFLTTFKPGMPPPPLDGLHISKEQLVNGIVLS